MRELVPLTNAVAAMMIRSVMSGRGGEDGLLVGPLTTVLTVADIAAVAPVADLDAPQAAMANAHGAPVAKSAAGPRAGSPANGRSGEHPSARCLLAAV